MVSRKPQFTKNKDKELPVVPKGRTPPSVSLLSLEDAYKDGAWTVPVGGELLVERRIGGKRQKTVCLVKAITETGVDTWDDTTGRWFNFNPAELEGSEVVVKVLRRPA